jgi:hypothetical protein
MIFLVVNFCHFAKKRFGKKNPQNKKSFQKQSQKVARIPYNMKG